MIRGVIFDMDGVLVDNKDVHIEAFLIFCRRYGLDTDTEGSCHFSAWVTTIL